MLLAPADPRAIRRGDLPLRRLQSADISARSARAAKKLVRPNCLPPLLPDAASKRGLDVILYMAYMFTYGTPWC
jgi:hypothetical protein